MIININSSSRTLVDELELNPLIGDFFNTVLSMRAKKVKSLRDYVALTRGAKHSIRVIRENLCRDESIKVATEVMACYKSHLETGRVYPYDMYLAYVKKFTFGDTNVSVRKDKDKVEQILSQMSTFRFDTTEEIVESASAIYVIMASIFGWETISVSPIVPHIT
jgi:hypothetical protein